MMPRKLIALLCLLFSIAAVAQVPHASKVWVISEENHSYENAIASMPYLMSLAHHYSYATQYYANAHPSIAALLRLTSGNTITYNDGTTSTYTTDNLARHLITQGLNFRMYAEAMPSAGFLGLSSGAYLKRHNPLLYYSDVADSSMRYDSVPFTHLAGDLSNHTTGRFNWVTPDIYHDGHNGSLSTADSWLHSHVPAILSQPEFQAGGSGLLVIVFDESSSGDNRCSSSVHSGCGGRILAVFIGPKVKNGHASTAHYTHDNLLKTICAAEGTSGCPGAASGAGSMADMFK